MCRRQETVRPGTSPAWSTCRMRASLSKGRSTRRATQIVLCHGRRQFPDQRYCRHIEDRYRTMPSSGADDAEGDDGLEERVGPMTDGRTARLRNLFGKNLRANTPGE